MSFNQAERVYTGNSIESTQSIGTVNYTDDGTLQIINIEGVMFKAGDIIYGEDSGYSFMINSFNLDSRVGAGTPWDTDSFITLDDGSVIVLDDFFTGTASQNYQKDKIVVQ